MAFETLGERIQGALKKLRGRGKLSEKDVDAAMREVRMALLEADVNFRVARSFTERVKERAVGAEVMGSLTPGQQVVKIVKDELTSLMGENERRLETAPRPPTVIMLLGLQGSGKTTTAAKLARHLRGRGRQPMLVAGDVHRPAAADQLQQLGDKIEVRVRRPEDNEGPAKLVKNAVSEARRTGADTVIVDTAGRLHIDEELMEELQSMAEAVEVTEQLLVLDAMTGQDAVTMAEEFNSRIPITGVVLTKLDGDARGGAALSVLEVTGCPIKFSGVGEKIEDLEVFHPERMASRILGMGDVLTLIEKAERSMDETRAKELGERLLKDQFTLDDFLEQLQQVKDMGPLDQLMSMIPGAAKQMGAAKIDEDELVKTEAIIRSMTPDERSNPDIIKRSRRRRIAQGSGTRVQDVNRLLKQYRTTREMFKQVSKGKMPRGKMPKMPFFD
ncbi:MAG: signal recognition particle protein [Clostridia bacterium]